VCFRSVLAAVLVAACAGGGDATAPAPTDQSGSRGAVGAVEFARPADTVDVGGARAMTVTLRDANGATLAGRSVVWSSSNPAVVRADVTGQPAGTVALRALRVGSATLTASAEGKRAQLALTVRETPVVSAELARSVDTLVVGTQRTVAVTLRDAHGAIVVGRTVSWTSSDTNVMRAESGGPSAAVVRGLAVGTATLVAASGPARAAVTFTVGTVPTRRIQIDTAPRTLRVGDSVAITATALDSGGRAIAGRVVEFTTAGAAGVVTVTRTGGAGGTTAHVRGVAAGSAALVATADHGARATVPFTVTAGPPGAPTAPVAPPTAAPTGTVGAVTFVPRRIVLGVGRTVAVPATVTSESGDTLTSSDVRYATGDARVATVDAGGRVTMVAAGATTLTATVGGRTATLALVALAPAAQRTFHIDLRFLGSPDPALVTAARQAAARWEAVVVASPGAFAVALAPNECGAGTPALNETVADLVIFVRLDSIDGAGGPNGNVVGSAGPCLVRESGGQYGAPIVGVVNLDAYDLLHASTPGTTLDAITHQIGHVLGIGTTWNIPGQRELVPGLRGGSFEYVGANAARAAYDLGFTASATAPWPSRTRAAAGRPARTGASACSTRSS
jgi:hypothetical protein